MSNIGENFELVKVIEGKEGDNFIEIRKYRRKQDVVLRQYKPTHRIIERPFKSEYEFWLYLEDSYGGINNNTLLVDVGKYGYGYKICYDTYDDYICSEYDTKEDLREELICRYGEYFFTQFICEERVEINYDE